MQSPFQFGKIVTGISFTNRTEEINRLTSNFLNGVNTVMISPRRWGKSSLIRQTANLVTESYNHVKFCYIDLFAIRSENEFYSRLSEEAIKATSTKVDEWIQVVKTFFKLVQPKITIGTDPLSEFNVSFDWKEAKKHPEEILNLPELIAKGKGIKLVVCIDEFQNMEFHENPVVFQKLLRSIWQRHEHAIYVLYGSKRHMMMNIFSHPGSPFYKFGDLITLKKIAETYLIQFIIDGFSRTDKVILPDYAKDIVQWTECHPYYSQQLAHLVWIRVDSKTTGHHLEHAFSDMLDQNSMAYQQAIENLSTKQINFLCALAEGIPELSSKNALDNYQLGTSANVVKIKRTLGKKELIDIINGRVDYVDPVFKRWIIREYNLNKYRGI